MRSVGRTVSKPLIELILCNTPDALQTEIRCNEWITLHQTVTRRTGRPQWHNFKSWAPAETVMGPLSSDFATNRETDGQP